LNRHRLLIFKVREKMIQIKNLFYQI